MLEHKTSFNKFKRTEIIQSIFSDHNRKLDINNEENVEYSETCGMKQHTLT